MTLIRGGPCCCRPGRYIRFVIPRGVTGCDPVISCRSQDGTGRESMREHEVPVGAHYAILYPGPKEDFD